MKKKSIIGISIIFSVLLMAQTAAVFAASNYITLPYHSQPNYYYCGPACLEMVFDFYGPDIPQNQIADAARTDSTFPDPFGTYTDEMRRAGHFSDLSTSMGNELATHVTGYDARGLGYASFTAWSGTTSNLENLIDAGYPIIVLAQGSEVDTWGHFRVVTGYDDVAQTIRVHDPMPTAWYAWGGPDVDYSYSDFNALWITGYMCFVSPWEVDVSSPALVSQGTTFMVTATIAYPCPAPFSTSDYPASSSEATIQLPAGLSLAVGETSTKSLGTLNAGASTNAQWNVVADSAGSYTVTVEAQGIVSGSVSGHPAGVFPTGYSYTDRIGGADGAPVSVEVEEEVTIESCDSAGAKKDTFQLGDDVYATGTGYSTSTTYDIFLVEDVTWVDGMAIPPRVSGTTATVTSDGAGNVPATLLWSDPLVLGKYDIVVDVDGDGLYYGEADALDDMDIEVTAGLLVIPEFWLGTILGLAGCFAAFGIFGVHKRRRL